MMIPRHLLAVPLLVAMLIAGAQLSAQGLVPLQAPGGVFRGPAADPASPHKLDLSVASTGGYDSNSMPDLSTVTLGAQDLTGYSTLLESEGDYSFQGRRLRARVTGASAQRYFQPTDRSVSPYFHSVGETGAAGLSLNSPRTSFAINETGVHSSAPLYALFAPAAAIPVEDPGALEAAPFAAPNLALNHYESLALSTSGTLTRGLSRHDVASIGADESRIRAVGGGVTRNLRTVGLRGQLSHRMNRSVMFTGAYFYRLGNIEDPGALISQVRIPQHGIEAGIDYRHALSKSRQVNLVAQLGGSTMSLAQPLEGGDIEVRRHNPLSGQVSFVYEFDRSWRARAAYRRDTTYAPGVVEPVLTQNVTAGVEGMLGRRIDVLMSGGFSNGESTFNLGSRLIETYTADTRVRYAVTRVLAGYVEYLYYFYNSGGTMALLPGIPTRLDRRGVRAGLMLRVAAF